MSWPAELDSTELTEHYVFANTPAYLFRHFKNTSTVKILAKKSPSDLAALCQEILSQPQRTRTDIARAYGAVAAMSMHLYSEWKPVVEALDLSRLDWGEQFRTIMQSQATAMSIVDVNVPRPKPSVQIILTD